MNLKLALPLLVVALLVVVLLAFCHSVNKADRLVRDAGSQLGASIERSFRTVNNISERFRSGTITQTFRAAVPHIESAGSGRLEVATSTVTESFERNEELRLFWGYLSLGSTESQIHVPVTYRYHVDLSDPWTIEVSGQTCLVYAPPVKPSQPPAIHTDEMEKRSESDWTRLDAGAQLEELEKSITPILRRYAADPGHLDLVREKSRKTIAEFIRNWLLREDHWREDRFRRIVVLFPDEILELRGPLEKAVK